MFVKIEHKVKIRDWMKNHEFILVTPDNITQVIDECIEAGVYGFDLETTGLDTRIFGDIPKTQIDIVGVCLCADPKRGYYMPVLHKPNGTPSPHNIPEKIFIPELRRLLTSESIPVVHNCKFEGEIMTYHGYGGEPIGNWDSQSAWEDTQILAYLDDSNRKTLGLKPLSKSELGKEMIELEELFPPGTKNKDYSTLDPTNTGVVEYAASDAICTLELYRHFYPNALELTSKVGTRPQSQNIIHKVEKLCVPAIRWMERNRVHIDLDKCALLMQKARVELVSSLREFYKEVGEMLGRDILPLSFFLFLRDMEKNDPELTVDLENVDAETLQDRFDFWKREASILQKRFSRREFGLLQSLEGDEELKGLLSRPTPEPKEGTELLSEYDVLSNAQLGVLMFDMGVPNLKRTETGAIKTSKDVIKDLIDNNKDLPFMEYVTKVRQNAQALKNLTSIWRDTGRTSVCTGEATNGRLDSTILIQFRAYAAATGRFSARGDKRPELSGGTSFNLQSMPSGKDAKAAESLLRIRECIAARPGFVTVAVDYSGQELRVSTNLSGEKLWIDQFFKCSTCETEFPRDARPPKYCPMCGSDRIGDIHTLTGIQLYGEAATKDAKAWKKKRNIAKGVNFALLFGGGPGSIENSAGVDKNEAFRIVSKFKSSYRFVGEWWKYSERFCRKHGYVLTAFERKHALPDIFHDQRFFQQKAVRNSKNSPIQGTGADLTKMSMGLIYQECKKLGWEKKVLLVITMHDELVFEIAEDILEPAVRMIVEIMTNNKIIQSRNWQVPLTVDVEIGPDWTVPYNLYEIEFLVGTRRELQNPENTEEDLARLVHRITGFYGSPERLQKSLSSFDDLRWPEFLAPHFESGRQDETPLTDAEKAMLQRAWDLAIKDRKIEVKAVAVPEVPSSQKPAPASVPTPSPVVRQIFDFRLESIDQEMAQKVANAIHESADVDSEYVLRLFDPDGAVVPFSKEFRVDPVIFNREMG